MKKTKTHSAHPIVFFADMAVSRMEKSMTLPAKFGRLLKRFSLDKRVKGKNVGIKVHLGGGLGYSTIHPIFAKILVDELKECGANRIKIMDNTPKDGVIRGYTNEILNCDIVSTFGGTRKYLYKEKIGYKTLDFVEFGGEALDCDFFIDFSHVKGHGDCGFGGALKNIAMGVVPSGSRSKLHHLEGGITYRKKRCTYCLKCLKACPNGALSAKEDKREIGIFFHHCTYCQHCVMACPHKALVMEERKFDDFSNGMALVTAKFLNHYKPENLLFINVLTQITIYCDCWGMTTPAVVPDIGILGSTDIAAIETASLDLIKTENFLSNSLPKGRNLLDNNGHLFERIHGKNPYRMVEFLKKHYACSSCYLLKEII